MYYIIVKCSIVLHHFALCSIFYNTRVLHHFALCSIFYNTGVLHHFTLCSIIFYNTGVSHCLSLLYRRLLQSRVILMTFHKQYVLNFKVEEYLISHACECTFSWLLNIIYDRSAVGLPYWLSLR